MLWQARLTAQSLVLHAPPDSGRGGVSVPNRQAEKPIQDGARPGGRAALGTKREFVDIPSVAKGREAPEFSTAKTKNYKKRPTAEQIEFRRKLELRELHADQRHGVQLLWSEDPSGRPGGMTFCGWTLIHGRDVVEVIRKTAPDTAPRAYLKGLQACDRGWVCPVCTRAKAEEARHRVNALLSRGRREGWHMVMMTLTVRHNSDMPLKDLWRRISMASDELRRTHSWKRLNKGLIGSLKAVEVTYGDNGWHPHYHVILAFPQDACVDQDEAIQRVERLRGAWMAEIAAQGLTGNDHAFDVQGAAAVRNYLTKWGTGEELTLGHAKTGRPGQRTPWQLLRDSRNGDAEAGELWLEFVRVIKGTHQLRMTPGIRSLIEEELAELELTRPKKEEAKEATIDIIPSPEWHDTARHRRVRIREAAEARTRRDAEHAVWVVRHGAETDRDLTDMVLIEDDDQPLSRHAHDEPEIRIAAIKADKAAQRLARKTAADRAWAELDHWDGGGG